MRMLIIQLTMFILSDINKNELNLSQIFIRIKNYQYISDFYYFEIKYTMKTLINAPSKLHHL